MNHVYFFHAFYRSEFGSLRYYDGLIDMEYKILVGSDYNIVKNKIVEFFNITGIESSDLILSSLSYMGEK